MSGEAIEISTVTPAPVTDGIILPGSCVDSEELIRPAGGGEGESARRNASLCGLCLLDPARYTCPRCNAPYCSLACYRGNKHLHCSEDFYKTQVMQHLEQSRGAEEGRRRVEEILMRMKEQGEGEEGAERLAGMDLDSLTEEEMWELLSEEEREKFEALLGNGNIGALVPEWVPWWERHGGEQVEDVDAGDESKTQDRIPAVWSRIPPLSSLSPHPSPLVRYTLVNAVYSYCFCLQRLNGDLSDRPARLEFGFWVLEHSQGLVEPRVFSSGSEALQSGLSAARTGPLFHREDRLAPVRAVLAVAHLLRGRGGTGVSRYSLGALSELRRVLGEERRGGGEEEEEEGERRRRLRARKKCEFLLAWVSENGAELPALSQEVQREYRRCLREEMEVGEGRAMLERSWGGEGRGRRKEPPGQGKLIQELD
ncbi:LOW QUALITY PROTEIN: zinc finger HIT domain-containing protein 2 [Polyodon spathula]|uniref:LOW QUALITY PROTEIN: zinc finger HIT domain-containing protein 2 n=1 Tax=Polyodon spathula TaxID=7913 RepID=UPI001B7DE2FA|nr:LOW QUALITY PROTEIN: zinc finger HIT domain-containing protein 2 [Polyodon spathula]